MAASLPPDLRVLCRKLTSLPPTDLPRALPSLTNHIIRCKAQLSAPQEQKTKDKTTEASTLVHKLKTSITTLLTSRTVEGRFTAIALVKAVVDVGGWEVLRNSEAWVRGLVAIIQKNDPAASKELAVITLTRLYMLIHPYQTLVREIVTPTLPAFATASIQLIKVTGSSLPSPTSLIEIVLESLTALIPLYPTTFRPFSSQIRNSSKTYVAPTSTEELPCIPVSLQRAAGQLIASLHHVAAKSGGGEEWGKLVDGVLKDIHGTSDQIFRAVDESWEGSNGYSRSPNFVIEQYPYGGGTTTEELSPWVGILAGSERLIGLCQYLSQCLSATTKSAVALPTGAIIDVVARLCSIARLSPKTQTWDQALQTKAAIDRDEKDELWSCMPDIHIAALRLVLTILDRLGEDAVPSLPEILDHLTRVFGSGITTPEIRATGYEVLKNALDLAGPTLSKASVNLLEPLIMACCRDLQEDAGHLKTGEKPKTSGSDSKKNGTTANADLFLQTASAASEVHIPTLSTSHRAAAKALLPYLLSSLNQTHLRPSVRAILDQTAILTRNREAMIASVLNPYRDPHGKAYANILPHFTQQYPNDQALEILRTNLRTDGVRSAEDLLDAIDEEDEDEENEDVDAEEKADAEMAEAADTTAAATVKASTDAFQPAPISAAPEVKTNLPIQRNPFEPSTAETTTVYGSANGIVASPPKRKASSPDIVPAKRQSVGEKNTKAAPMPAAEEGEDESDDESVHLNMEFDDDEE